MKRPSLAAKRAHLTEREWKAMFTRQDGICGCGCGVALDVSEGIIAEHVFDLVSLGNAGKPDSLYRKPCAKAKTNGPRGDITWAAHIKRLAFKRTQADDREAAGGSRMRSRGFDKTKTRGFDGRVKDRAR